MSRPKARNVLMIYPRFTNESFWNYRKSCAVVGAHYPTIPLGLITVAAMLPRDWNVRLVNRNTEELADADLEWADLVMSGGMLFQQASTLDIIELCRERGKPVAVGGPDVSSSPHVYERANFRVVGEAEGVIDKFIDAVDSGSNEGLFEAPKFQIDVTKTPKPRFDLLKFDQYMHLGVQYSRGCPFTCEFCDIIELYGRVPRTKTAEQMLDELEALYQLGYRGHVDFVDDNLIGNKKALKLFLPHLIAWLEERDYPFEFSTEASLNLADDAELIALLKKANFFLIFIGIESPDTDTLIAMRKKQNTRRSIPDSVHKIYRAGIFVTAGFIVGFDSEKGSVAEPMIESDRGGGDPDGGHRAVVGAAEHPVDAPAGARRPPAGRQRILPKGSNDQIATGLNFETKRPRLDVLRDLRTRAGHGLHARRLLRPHRPAGLAARLVGPPPRNAQGRHPRQDRHRQCRAGDPAPHAGAPRAVLAHLHQLPEHQSRRDTRRRHADGLLPPHRPVYALRHRAARQPDRGARAGHIRRPATAAAG